MTVMTSASKEFTSSLAFAQGRTCASLPLRVVRNEQDFKALQPFWNRLLQRSAVRTPFMTWDWVSLWYEQHRDQCQLCVAVIDDPRNGEPLAIAPLMLARPISGHRRAMRHLTFIGTIGEDGSQGMDFIVPAGDEEQLTPLLCKAFTRNLLKWDVIDLPSMHEESPNLPFIRHALAQCGHSGERSAPQNSFLMRLPSSWDEQLAQWKSKERSGFKSKWRKLADEHGARYLQGGIDFPAEQAFDELWRLHALRFQGQHSCFLSEPMHRLHRELVKRWAPDGRVMLSLVEADGRIVAARYGFAIDGKYWSYQTGFDPDYARLAVGIMSLGWAAQCAIGRGLRELDHMPGEARYKSDWSTHTRRVVHLESFSHLSLTAIVFRVMRAIKRRRAALEAPEPSQEVTE